MFGLPVKTEFSKRIPKNKFYSLQSISPQVKQMFVSQLDSIIWQNKLSKATVNVSTEAVEEIEVFEIVLKSKELNEEVLKLIDKAIQYHLVFVLSYDKMYKVAIGNKQRSNNNQFVVTNQYFYSEWKNEVELKLKGLSLDNVYDNWIKELIPVDIRTDEDLQQTIERYNQIDKLKREIAQVEAKMNKTKQFNKKVELNNDLKKLLKKQITYEKD